MVDEDDFAAGCRLFDNGRFFECHEVWESVWKRANGADRLFFQGLIQVAAALLHAERGNRTGAATLWKKAADKLSRFPSPYYGISLAEFMADLNGYFTALAEDTEPGPAPSLSFRHR